MTHSLRLIYRISLLPLAGERQAKRQTEHRRIAGYNPLDTVLKGYAIPLLHRRSTGG